jgi:hypothetical protein
MYETHISPSGCTVVVLFLYSKPADIVLPSSLFITGCRGGRVDGGMTLVVVSRERGGEGRRLTTDGKAMTED